MERRRRTAAKDKIYPPLEFSLPDGIEQPLYLHCEETNAIQASMPVTTAITRGQRLTGEVFNGSIKCFGLYGRVGTDYTTGEEVLGTGVEIKQETLSNAGGWYETSQDLDYADEENMWTADKKGYFYGYAPFPGSGDGQAKCISVGRGTDGKPLLTFTMQADEKDNVDILTACTENLSEADKDSKGVELQFRHVLSALKFKLSGDAKELTARIDGVDYYIQMKSVKIEGIYAQGTLPIATTSVGSTTTWTRDGANTTGDCEITTADMRSRDDITTDSYLNTDEHCLMVMPQTAPDGARLVVTCDITQNADGSGVKKLENVSYSAELKDRTWLPGYTYTYTFNKYKEIVQSAFTSADFANTTASVHAVTGGADNFSITSSITRIAGDGTISSTEPAAWHTEYSTDGGLTWRVGLPSNFAVIDASTNKAISNIRNIPGGDNVAYQLKSFKRTDGSTSVLEMSQRNYVASDGDFIDLSTNTISGGTITTRSRSTANCYVIDGCGKFKLPLVYGNAILNGSTNSAAYTEQVEPKSNTTYQVFFNYNDQHISQPYILDDVPGVSIDDLSASIVWMDETNLIDVNTLEILKEDKGYIAFEVHSESVKPGNVVIAVKDGSGTIMWSWHIWLTTLPMQVSDAVELSVTRNSVTYNFAMARANLGRRVAEDHIQNTGVKSYSFRAVQNGTGKVISQHDIQQEGGETSIPTSSIYYQFGRKDPVPAAYPDPERTSFTAQNQAIRMEDLINDLGYNYVRGANGTLRTMAYAIQHPDEVVNPGDAYTWMIPHGASAPTSNSDKGWNSWRYGTALWNVSYALDVPAVNNQTKTVYDPSPYGYMVATRLAKYWANTITKEVTGISSSYNWISYNYIYVFDYTDDIRFPLCGARNHSSANMESVNAHGYVWTTGAIYNATAASNNQVHVFGPYYSKNNSKVYNNSSATLNQGRGLPVRCMRDDKALNP